MAPSFSGGGLLLRERAVFHNAGFSGEGEIWNGEEDLWTGNIWRQMKKCSVKITLRQDTQVCRLRPDNKQIKYIQNASTLIHCSVYWSGKFITGTVSDGGTRVLTINLQCDFMNGKSNLLCIYVFFLFQEYFKFIICCSELTKLLARMGLMVDITGTIQELSNHFI